MLLTLMDSFTGFLGVTVPYVIRKFTIFLVNHSFIMDIVKFLFVVWNFTPIMAFTFEPKIWYLDARKPSRSFEQGIVEYFENKTGLLSVAIRVDYSKSWKFVINGHLAEAFRGKNSLKFEIFSDGHRRKHKFFKYNLWYVDSFKGFQTLLPDIDNRRVDKRGQYMVVMDSAKHLNSSIELQRIVEKAFERNIVDIAVAIYDNNYTFNLYNYDIFRPGTCRQVMLHQYNKFQDGKFMSPDLFPYKFHDFHQCPIDFHMRLAAPFFSYNLTSDKKRIDQFWGLEAKIIKTMAAKLNFKLRLKQSYGKIVGHVFDNGTFTGPFRAMMDRKFDILMGYYHFPERSQYFTVSEPYFHSISVVVIRKQRNYMLEGQWIVAPFRVGVWFLIILTVIWGMAMIYVVRHLVKTHLSLRVTWLDVFGLAIGNARLLRYHLLATNIVIIVWNWGFLMICATFGGKLYEAFNKYPGSSPMSVAKLVAQNYTFLIKNIFNEELTHAWQIPTNQIIFTNFANDEIGFETLLNATHPVALLTNYWQLQSFIASRRLHDEFYMVPRTVVLNQICAYLRPQSYLVEPYNRFLRHLQYGEILKKWMRDITGGLHLSGALQQLSRRTAHIGPLQLSLQQLSIVFLGLIIGHSISLLVFLGEIIVHFIIIKK
ncbi:uncharacterized protein LOC142235838 [Haematobia irritans]|uniref:uncharacterized protein LOC142235838 n=1 Tax=Haematobia irritans TaxID=7368 RepID=UPI003F4FE93D